MNKLRVHKRGVSLEKDQLLALIEEGFQHAAWHGPNLRSAIRGVKCDEAIWRPAIGIHNIWEVVVHAAYWKYRVKRRLEKSESGGFPEKGNNWFPRDKKVASLDEMSERWRNDQSLLVDMHNQLCAAVVKVSDDDLRSLGGSKKSPVQNIIGVAMHDVYHAGQIRLLRKLYRSPDGRRRQ